MPSAMRGSLKPNTTSQNSEGISSLRPMVPRKSVMIMSLIEMGYAPILSEITTAINSAPSSAAQIATMRLGVSGRTEPPSDSQQERLGAGAHFQSSASAFHFAPRMHWNALRVRVARSHQSNRAKDE